MPKAKLYIIYNDTDREASFKNKENPSDNIIINSGYLGLAKGKSDGCDIPDCDSEDNWDLHHMQLTCGSSSIYFWKEGNTIYCNISDDFTGRKYPFDGDHVIEYDDHKKGIVIHTENSHPYQFKMVNIMK